MRKCRFWRGEYSSIVGVPIMEGSMWSCAAVMPRRDKDEAIRMADAIVDALNALERREGDDGQQR